MSELTSLNKGMKIEGLLCLSSTREIKDLFSKTEDVEQAQIRGSELKRKVKSALNIETGYIYQ